LAQAQISLQITGKFNTKKKGKLKRLGFANDINKKKNRKVIKRVPGRRTSSICVPPIKVQSWKNIDWKKVERSF